MDSHWRERELYKIPYGALLHVKDGDKVELGRQVAKWDPSAHPMVAELAGVVSFEDFIAGVTVSEEVDEVTGLTSLVVIDPKQRGMEGKDLRPTIRLLDSAGEPLNIPGTSQPAQYFPPAGAIINCSNGDRVGT